LLDINFIIPIVLIIIGLFVYIIILKKLKPNNLTNSEFELFLKNVKNHMKQFHPKIKIDYSKIDKKKKDESLEDREKIVIESVIAQYFNSPYEKNTQDGIAKEKYWLNYYEKSVSNSKFPSDWPLRKEAALRRDDSNCNRCGQRLTYDESTTTFVKDINKGGGYNLENIIILCSDCNRILNTNNPKNTMYSLTLNDKLMVYVR
jgi:hypothetical protein